MKKGRLVGKKVRRGKEEELHRENIHAKAYEVPFNFYEIGLTSKVKVRIIIDGWD